jgi:hypothetical protein
MISQDEARRMFWKNVSSDMSICLRPTNPGNPVNPVKKEPPLRIRVPQKAQTGTKESVLCVLRLLWPTRGSCGFNPLFPLLPPVRAELTSRFCGWHEAAESLLAKSFDRPWRIAWFGSDF